MELIESIRETLDKIEEEYRDELTEKQGVYFDDEGKSYFNHPIGQIGFG